MILLLGEKPKAFSSIENINRINAGYGSECFYILTKDNSYILKLSERNSMNNINQLQSVHEALAQAGINVVKFFKNIDGQLITQYKEKSCILQSYINGSI